MLGLAEPKKGSKQILEATLCTLDNSWKSMLSATTQQVVVSNREDRAEERGFDSCREKNYFFVRNHLKSVSESGRTWVTKRHI